MKEDCFMECPIVYELTDEELRPCIEFANASAPTQQDVEFGQHDQPARNISEIARDNLIGKIAEVAFKRIVEQRYPAVGEIPLDFQVYQRGEYDDQDATINGCNIDIKATREGGEWFLIEWNKLDFRARENKLPDYFAFFTVGWDRNRDVPTGTATLEGIIPIEWLSKEHVDGEERIKVLRSGESIPGKSVTLQADNYGINKTHISRRLKHYVDLMMRGQRYNKDEFVLPGN